MNKILEFIKDNKRLILLFIVFVSLLSFTIYNKFIKKEEKKATKSPSQSNIFDNVILCISVLI